MYLTTTVDDASTRFVLDMYVSVPLHIHVPSLRMELKSKILLEPIICDKKRQVNEASNSKSVNEVPVVSPIPHWKKKGPMQWDNVKQGLYIN